jgi:hypothetical protein
VASSSLRGDEEEEEGQLVEEDVDGRGVSQGRRRKKKREKINNLKQGLISWRVFCLVLEKLDRHSYLLRSAVDLSLP